jgi:site-specific recombinase XerC
MLIGCGLRRAELLALTLESIQLREDHRVTADLVGKGRHLLTVPIPTWVKNAVDEWTVAAGMTHSVVFRAIDKAGRVWSDGCLPRCSGPSVRAAAARANIEKLAPHVLRRTCARLCHLAGGELDQIQLLWGTSRFRRPSAIRDASRSCAVRSTISSVSSQRPWCDRLARADERKRPPLATTRGRSEDNSHRAIP